MYIQKKGIVANRNTGATTAEQTGWRCRCTACLSNKFMYAVPDASCLELHQAVSIACNGRELEAYRLVEHGDQQIEEQDHAQQEEDGFPHHHKPGIVLAASKEIISVTAYRVKNSSGIESLKYKQMVDVRLCAYAIVSFGIRHTCIILKSIEIQLPEQCEVWPNSQQGPEVEA